MELKTGVVYYPMPVECECKYIYSSFRDAWVLIKVCSKHNGVLHLGQEIINKI